MKNIPSTATELQTGLWLQLNTFYIGKNSHIQRELYSSNGYCFYDKTEEIFDEEGNLLTEILPNQRTYYQYMSLGKDKDINDLVSVEIENDFTIV